MGLVSCVVRAARLLFAGSSSKASRIRASLGRILGFLLGLGARDPSLVRLVYVPPAEREQDARRDHADEGGHA